MGTRGQGIEAMARHPILIQRPIITADDGTAVLALSRGAVRSVVAVFDHVLVRVFVLKVAQS